MAKLYGIGVGPGNPELITVKAINILKKIDIVAVPKSKNDEQSIALDIANPYLNKNTKIIFLEFPMIKNKIKLEEFRKTNAGKIIDLIKKNKNIAFLTLGDPLFYSTFIYLFEYLDRKIDIEIVPGVFSFSAIASKIQMPLVKGNESIAVFTDFNKNKIEKALLIFNTIIFMKVSTYHKELALIIKEKKMENNFAMISNYGFKNEKISKNINDLKDNRIDYLTTLILKNYICGAL